MKVLVTGAAGFIGAALCERLLARGDMVVGVDNLNDYYDVALKEARLARLEPSNRFRFYRVDICDTPEIRAGLRRRASPNARLISPRRRGCAIRLQNPRAYVDTNIVGFLNILEASRNNAVEHWSTLRPARFTAQIRSCHSRCTTTWTTRCPCTRDKEGKRADGAYL